VAVGIREGDSPLQREDFPQVRDGVALKGTVPGALRARPEAELLAQQGEQVLDLVEQLGESLHG